jgi:hypothetical protein
MRLCQASVMMAMTGKHQRTGQVNDQRACACDGEPYRIGRDGMQKLLPCLPDRRQAGEEEDPCEDHSQTSAPDRGPSQSKQDQEIQRRVFEEINAIGKEGDRTDSQSNGELHSKIGQICQRHKTHRASQRCI